jgi:hypothetical protein
VIFIESCGAERAAFFAFSRLALSLASVMGRRWRMAGTPDADTKQVYYDAAKKGKIAYLGLDPAGMP